MPKENNIIFKEAAISPSALARKPELLCPAGSIAAFDAAIEAGADAIYIGGSAFNARANAKNFTEDEMKSAIARAHGYGVKVYVAANTLIYDKELCDYLTAAKKAYLAGADALIVADLGAAAYLRRYIPDAELHASTQISGHNIAAAKKLSELGFSRMVLAREMCKEDIASFCKNSPIEAEVFVHGALCVCHSGQCLFSSLVGGRSGNRGECAQPCRLPYRSKDKRGDSYPLSLKDLCLARYIPELCQMGVASFKIEGRMKSPEYVRDVTAIWRRLIDEGRGADDGEIEELARIFSRDGFTEGYYTKKINSSILGVRSEGNKKDSRELVPFTGISRKIPISFDVKVKKGEPIALTVIPNNVTVYSDPPLEAINSPSDRESLLRSLSKLGGTAFELKEVYTEIDDGVMVPASKLNALRRAALEAIGGGEERGVDDSGFEEILPGEQRGRKRSAMFYSPSSISESAREFFDIIYLPLDRYDGSTRGVALPPVIYDSEADKIEGLLAKAREQGAEDILIGNLGHIELAKKFGFKLHGDFRFNVSSNASMASLESLGFEDVILSPELTLPKIRDIGGKTFATVYGRVPLMVTEKCVGKELGTCAACEAGKSELTDRKNIRFPVLREWEHRSLIFNSVPVYMGDKQDELRRFGVTMQHFIFSVESRREVDDLIACYKKRLPYKGQFTRI